MNEALHLDHVGHVVADLAAASRLYARLGFDLLPVSHHQTPGPDGRMVPGGTSNQCAMLEQGYLELLTVTDRHAPSYSARENAAFLDRFEGLHLLAFGTRDAAATRARLQGEGVAFSARELGRMIDGPGGRAEARFRLTPVDALTDADSIFFFIEHLTRELVWPPGSIRHSNGARRLAELLLVSDDPSALARGLSAALGRHAAHDAGAFVWQLERSRLIVATPHVADARLGTPVARREGVHAAAVAVDVANLDATAGLLRGNGVPFSMHDGRLTVAQESCFGVALQFCGAAP